MISLPSMSRILKRLTHPAAVAYQFPDAADLPVDGETPPIVPEETPAEERSESAEPMETSVPEPPTEQEAEPPAESADAKTTSRVSSLDYAQVQADAIMAQARREAEELKEQALAEAQEELAALRNNAHAEGYQAGYNAGMADGMTAARAKLNQMAEEQTQAVKDFLETAAKEKEQLLDDSQEELKDLALAVAEKVIRISLKSNSDILLRMIEAA